MTTTTFTSAYQQAQAERTRTRKPRTPLTVTAARFLGRHLPTWSNIRTTVYAIAGFGLIDAAAWQYETWSGLLVTGISVLIVEALSGDK